LSPSFLKTEHVAMEGIRAGFGGEVDDAAVEAAELCGRTVASILNS
jgi:hypothetical protein